MYHHHSQQDGPPQPFSNRPGPFHHQEQAHQQQQQQQQQQHQQHNQQHSHFQYPSNMGSRDMDMVPMDMDIEMGLDRMNGSGSGGYSSNPQPLSESQPGHQQGLDWSNYQHPGQMFSSSPSTVTQQPQSSHSAMGTQAWTHAPVYEPPSPQTRGSHSRGVDRQGISESAGSILASFGLSSQDLEVLSQYPEDQLTPDKLPHILQDMLRRKSNDHDIAASSSSSYSQSATRAARETLPPPSCSQRSSERWQSPEGSSLRSVAQTAGKCIDYGHSSLATDVSSSREAFIREPLSSERKMVSRCPPMDMPERWHVRPQPAETNRHRDLDYRRSSGEVLNSKRSPAAEFPLPPRSRRPDLDYRRDAPKRSPSSETRKDYSTSSRRPAPLSSLSKSRDGTKRLPTPSMICDFSAESPKVYPHTCTLCLIDCEQAKGWSEHVKSAKHTDSCRNLHNKYPEWKPNVPRREPHSLRQDDSRTPKERSPSRSVSARRERTERERERLKREDHGRGKDPRPSSIHSPNRSNRGSSSSSSHRPERRAHHSPAAAGRSSRDSLKRPRDKSATRDDGSARSKLPSSAKSPIKTTPKPGSKITKPGSSKADETSTKGPPAKKVSTPSSQSTKAASHLVHPTGVPTMVTEEEVTDFVRGFEKIYSVVLLAGNEAKEEEEEQKKPEADDSTAVSKGTSSQELSAIGGEDSGNGPKLHKKTSEEEFSLNPMVVITRLSESDVIKLCQPFGAPTDIILATQLGKESPDDDKDSRTVPTADKEDSILQVNGKSIPGGIKSEGVNLNNVNAEESPANEKDSQTVPTADKEDSIPREKKKEDVNIDNRNAEDDEKISGNVEVELKEDQFQDFPDFLDFVTVDEVGYTTLGMEEANAETSGARGDQNAVKAEEKRRGGDMGTWGRERKEVERREREAKERRKRYREDSPGSGSKKGSKRNSRRDGSDEAKPETSGPQGGKSVLKAQEKKEDRAKHLQTEEERHQQEGKGSEARRGKDARERREQEVKEKVKRDRERERKVMEGSSGSRSEGSTGNSKRDGPGGPLASDEAKKESPANDRDSHTVPTADQEDSIPHKASPPPDAVSMDTTVMESPDDDKDSHTVPTAEEEDSILKDYGKSDFTEIFYSYGVVIGYHCKLCDHRAVARRAAEIRDHLNGRKHNVMLIQTKSLRSLYLAKKRDDIEDICRDEGIVAVNKHPSTRFHCKLCERDYRSADVYHHLMGKWHIGSLWAKKQKDKLRDEALKKTSRKDEAAGKVLCKDQENIKVGEDVKTDKTKVGLAQQSEERKTINTLPEELNEIKETKSSSSAAGDGEASSSKPADLQLPKESPADDKDSHTVPTADQEDSIPQDHGNSVYLEEVCFDDGTVFGFHCKVCECSFLTDTKDAHLKGSVHQENEIEAIANLNKYVVEVNNPNESRCFYCRLCDCSVANLSTMDFHMKGRKHAAKLRAKDGTHARKLKAKDQLDKDRLDFKVELEEDQFQDLPHFLDFETVDEVGNVNDFPGFPPPDAVTMDTTVMVDKESPANMRDSHTVPTADKEDSITQENEKSVPREKKKCVKMDNRNAEGDSKFSGEDEYVEEIPNRNSKVILLHCKLCKCIFQKNNTFAKEQHLKGQRHAISLQLLVEKSKTEECFEEVRTPNGKVIFLRCKLCEGSIGLNAKDQHLKTETHTRRLEIKRYFDAKKLKEDKLRDDTDEKTSSKDEAAGKELSKDQQDIKVGEELSNAAPTQVCKADVKTDKIKVALAKQPDEGKPINTPPEELDKINPGPKETTSSSSAAGDGEVSSRKPADLDLPKESPGDDKDSHTVPTADKEDSTPQENKKSAPRERKKDFNVDNRNLEGDEKISGKDEYIEEVRDAVGKVILYFRCNLCECRLNNFNNKQQHLKGKSHNLLLLGKKRKAMPTADKVDLTPQLNEKSLPGRKTKGGVDNKNAEVSEKISGKDEYVEVRNPSGKVILLLCKVCERSIKLNDKDQHPKTEAHTQRLKRKCFSDAKKLKEGKPRDDADEKTSCKDEAAGKELSKDRQDIKVGQVCKQPEESKTINTSPEGLNKINSGPKETTSSSSAAGDGEDSSNKPADLELSKDSHTAPTADQEDSTPRGNDKSVPGEKTKKKGGNKMDNKNAQGDEKTGGKDAYVEEVRSSIGKVIRLHCNLCECSVMLNAKDQHLKTDTHQRRLKLRRYFDAKKLKEGELRHETDEKISSKDEAAGKEPSKDQQDIKVGEELSNAAPTQVCNPEAEGLDKINSGPKETKSSSSAAGDGEVSSNKPDDLELPKVEPEEDQFQDFPFDMADFVTVDEVGDGDESDLPGSPPAPAAVSTVTSEAVEEEKSTETPRESEAEATPVPEDTPQASPGPVTLATAAPEKSETHSQTLDPVVTAEQHPHSPAPPQAMCSSDQLDAPVSLPVADDSLPTSSSPKGATTPDLEACSSGVTPTAGGEQENQGPVGHSQAEEEVTEKVEQMEDEEDKEKPAASVSAKRLMSEDKRREEEPMQKKQKIQAATADDPLPFDPNNSADAPAGMEFLVPRTGFFCQVCNSFFSGEQESELNHCKSLEHNDNLQKYLKSRKTTSS